MSEALPKKIAILIRGHHHQARDRFGYPMDFTGYVENFYQMIVKPLASLGTIYCFITTYESPIANRLPEFFPGAIARFNNLSSRQLDTFYAGLKLIQETQISNDTHFDLVVCTRFDLHYKLPITAWTSDLFQNGITFPWREYELLWNNSKRIGDCLQIISKDYFGHFLELLRLNPWKNNGHHLFNSLNAYAEEVAVKIPVHFMTDGFYDSNTLYALKEANNPIYWIANRPHASIPLSHPFENLLSID